MLKRRLVQMMMFPKSMIQTIIWWHHAGHELVKRSLNVAWWSFIRTWFSWTCTDEWWPRNSSNSASQVHDLQMVDWRTAGRSYVPPNIDSTEMLPFIENSDVAFSALNMLALFDNRAVLHDFRKTTTEATLSPTLDPSAQNSLKPGSCSCWWL